MTETHPTSRLERSPTRLRVRLYIAGDGPNSVAALSNLRTAIARSASAEDVEVEVIDVVKTPETGLRDGVFITPMLVRVQPAPERRLLGSLKDRASLLAAL